jgi:hypothetical protein
MAVLLKRSSIIYASMIAFTAWFGSCARQYAFAHPGSPADFASDTLWALTVFSTMGLLFPAMPSWQAASGAFIIPTVLEIGQFYSSSSWLVAMRGTPVGFLVFGTGSFVTDFACYAFGALAGMLIEMFIFD